MKIQMSEPSANQALWARDRKGSNQVRNDGQNLETPEPSPLKPTQPDAGNDGRAKGAIRHLQEGHFKGVADIRLRINFADEISALDAVAQAEKVSAGVDGIESQVTSWLDHQDLTMLSQEKKDGLMAAFEAFAAPLPDPGDDPLADLKNRFASLVEDLSALAPAQVEEPPVEPVVEVSEDPLVEPGTFSEPTEETPIELQESPLMEGLSEETAPLAEPVSPEPEDAADFDWAGLIGGLETDFDQWVTALETEAAATSALPSLSPPMGNGQAYARFLEIYQNMSAPRSEPEPALETLV